MKILVKLSEYTEYPGMLNIFWNIVWVSGCKIKGQAEFGDEYSAINGRYLLLCTESKTGEWTDREEVADGFVRSAANDSLLTINLDFDCRTFVNSVTENVRDISTPQCEMTPAMPNCNFCTRQKDCPGLNFCVHKNSPEQYLEPNLVAAAEDVTPKPLKLSGVMRQPTSVQRLNLLLEN